MNAPIAKAPQHGTAFRSPRLLIRFPRRMTVPTRSGSGRASSATDLEETVMTEVGNKDHWGFRATGSSPSLWAVPVVTLAVGAVTLAAFVASGDVVSGLVWFAIATACGVSWMLAGPTKVFGVARPGPKAELDAVVDVRALAFAATVLITLLTGRVVVAVVHGEGLTPYVQLLAVGGASYALGQLAFRVRTWARSTRGGAAPSDELSVGSATPVRSRLRSRSRVPKSPDQQSPQ